MFTLSACGESNKSSGIYEMTGLIDNKYPVTMSLTINKDGRATGSYYYDKNKKDIIINSSSKMPLILEESVDGELMGKFIGTFDKENIVFTGAWRDPKSKKYMSFNLTQKATTGKVSNTKDDISLEKLAGTFENEYGTEVELILKGRAQMYINGMVVTSTGNIGKLDDFVIGYNNGELIYKNNESDYKLAVKILNKNTIEIEETNPQIMHGMGAGFDGIYKKLK